MLSLTTIASAKTIRIGTEGAYPPWNNLNSAGELEGAEIDFGNEACKRMGVECEWVTHIGTVSYLLYLMVNMILLLLECLSLRKEKKKLTLLTDI
jgi:polar amino acid transport system substrate-binding protein